MKIKALTIFIILLSLSACGFKPMLAKNIDGQTILDKIQLVSVEGPDQPRLHRIISQEIGSSNNSYYQLRIQVHQEISSIGVMKDGQSTRYKVKDIFNYNLVETHTQDSVDSGSIFLYSSYDVPQSEFANYISERSTNDNLIEELCRELKSRLILVLSSRGER